MQLSLYTVIRSALGVNYLSHLFKTRVYQIRQTM